MLLIKSAMMISLGLLLGLTIPFNIDRRPLPSGNDFSKILPAKVGSFTRTTFTAPGPGMDGEAKYTRKNEEIFMLSSFADTDPDRVETMKTIYSELKINATTEHPLISIKTNPSYLHYVGKDMAFFAWTRGKYCFSADAREGNKKTLTDFMEQFPH